MSVSVSAEAENKTEAACAKGDNQNQNKEAEDRRRAKQSKKRGFSSSSSSVESSSTSGVVVAAGAVTNAWAGSNSDNCNGNGGDGADAGGQGRRRKLVPCAVLSHWRSRRDLSHWLRRVGLSASSTRMRIVIVDSISSTPTTPEPYSSAAIAMHAISHHGVGLDKTTASAPTTRTRTGIPDPVATSTGGIGGCCDWWSNDQRNVLARQAPGLRPSLPDVWAPNQVSERFQHQVRSEASALRVPEPDSPHPARACAHTHTRMRYAAFEREPIHLEPLLQTIPKAK
jgi:hypothetical protein